MIYITIINYQIVFMLLLSKIWCWSLCPKHISLLLYYAREVRKYILVCGSKINLECCEFLYLFLEQ